MIWGGHHHGNPLEIAPVDMSSLLPLASALAPALLMLLAMLLPQVPGARVVTLWKQFSLLSGAALLSALVALALQWALPAPSTKAVSPLPWLAAGALSAWMALLVQFLGTVIGVFSSRYLQGEPGQQRYLVAFAGVMAAVHLLLLANHWLVLIAAWAAVGVALQHLLCFYNDRPFALLAAHKKRLADRLADVFLLAAAALAWSEVGSGYLSDLWQHVAQGGASIILQLSAVCLVLAVILRTALLPVHGWLIQVMEAPTPVSALLHAGVVNLGGFVLIRFAPLLEAAPPARWLLIVFGLATAVLAGLVMLTRISIKVRLAWSTVAQMGFMVLECGLGLYTLAALHLLGHSLYKAHAFLSASTVVQQSRLQMMRGGSTFSAASLLFAPPLAVAVVALVQVLVTGPLWPWWWSGVLALAWAPLLWLPPVRETGVRMLAWRAAAGVGMVASLTLLLGLAHVLPLGLVDNPAHFAGITALIGMGVLYLALLSIQWRAHFLVDWRRWSYAGYYVDEFYTRLALRIWPTPWAPAAATRATHPIGGLPVEPSK